MATLKKLYSDIDLTFSRQPGKGDIVLSYDDQAVIRSVRNLLLTNFYERPFQPDVGSNLNALLFENASAATANALEEEIRNVIVNYEPRALIESVYVSALPDQNSYSVTLTFFIGNNTQPTNVTLLLTRNR
jgi:phage baseplate assembly protein W